MIKISSQLTCFALTSVFFLILLSSAYPIDNNFIQKVKETEMSAYTDVNNNRMIDALQKLIELFRTVPENDIESAEALLGPLHLYNFIISEFYRPEYLYKEKLIQKDQYPSDKLLMAVACLNDTTARKNMAYPVMSWLGELTQIDNLSIKFLADTVSVYSLTSEEYLTYKTRDIPLLSEINKQFVNLFFEKYPDSLATQFVLQDLLNRSIEKVISTYTMDDAATLVQTYIERPGNLYLLASFNGAGISSDKVNILSGFTKAKDVLPSLNLFDISEQVIRKWAEILQDEQDVNARYTLITFLKCSNAINKDYQEIIKTALLSASRKTDLTTDVLYAKFTLLDLAMKYYWIKEAEESLMDISQLEILPPMPGIKSVYTRQKLLMEKGASFFTRLGYYDIAKNALNIQLNKYRNSNFEIGVKTKLKKLEKSPLDYSLEQISQDRAKSGMKGNYDSIRKYYDGIIEHTPNPNLKNYLMNHDITQPVKYNIDQATVVNDVVFDKLREISEQKEAQKTQQ